MFRMSGIHVPRYENDGCGALVTDAVVPEETDCWLITASGGFPAVIEQHFKCSLNQ